jgi:hypothetical protein
MGRLYCSALSPGRYAPVHRESYEEKTQSSVISNTNGYGSGTR